MVSKDVFAKRKAGEIDEAYEMALQLVEAPEPGEWDFKALGWCLIDMIKRESKTGQSQNLERYRKQLEALELNPNDEVISGQRDYALKLCSPNGQEMQRAKNFSQQGRHLDAVRIYSHIFNASDQSDGLQTCFGWELYHLAKQVLGQDQPNFGLAHQCLRDYSRLKVEKQPRLHSCILNIADKMAKADKLSLGGFVRVWDLEKLTAEDFERFISNDGKSYPALAERVVQKAIKDAFGRKAVEDMKYLIPYLNKCIERFHDNLWLKYYKAKALILLGRPDEALSFGLEVVKNKANDFWPWALLADIHQTISPDLRLACYCKALLCSKDINFVTKVKLHLAAMLIERGEYDKAKFEIDEVVSYRSDNDQKIPQTAAKMMEQDWYSSTIATSTNWDFYLDHAKAAEELLYSELAWINANFGECFTSPQKPGKPRRKPRRKLYIENSDMPFEAVIAESKVAMLNLQAGAGVRIKGELDDRQCFQVYTVQERNGHALWDTFEEQVGVVDHVNTTKKLLHFIIDRKLDGVVHFAELQDTFLEGDAIAVRFSNFTGNNGTQLRVVTARKTDEPIPSSLLKTFDDHVRVSKGMGFTDGDIFIAPPLVEEHHITDDCMISGTAILNYNKKRFEWGWKAIKIAKVAAHLA